MRSNDNVASRATVQEVLKRFGVQNIDDETIDRVIAQARAQAIAEQQSIANHRSSGNSHPHSSSDVNTTTATYPTPRLTTTTSSSTDHLAGHPHISHNHETEMNHQRIINTSGIERKSTGQLMSPPRPSSHFDQHIKPEQQYHGRVGDPSVAAELQNFKQQHDSTQEHEHIKLREAYSHQPHLASSHHKHRTEYHEIDDDDGQYEDDVVIGAVEGPLSRYHRQHPLHHHDPLGPTAAVTRPPSSRKADISSTARRMNRSHHEDSNIMHYQDKSLTNTATNVIYDLTPKMYLLGGRNYHTKRAPKGAPLGTLGSGVRPSRQGYDCIRRPTDPVSRGNEMRNYWKSDPFLNQRKPRQRLRWEVRRTLAQDRHLYAPSERYYHDVENRMGRPEEGRGYPDDGIYGQVYEGQPHRVLS